MLPALLLFRFKVDIDNTQDACALEENLGRTEELGWARGLHVLGRFVLDSLPDPLSICVEQHAYLWFLLSSSPYTCPLYVCDVLRPCRKLVIIMRRSRRVMMSEHF